MNKKLEYLKNHHSVEFISKRAIVFNELSEKQSIFCCCGQLASGLHESRCRKFNAKVDKETVNRLNHLIPNKL